MTNQTDAFERISGLVQQVSVILRSFADMRSDDVDMAVNFALASIGKHTGVDRTYVFTIDEDGAHMTNSHEWCAEGVQPEIHNLKNIPSDSVDYWWPRLHAGEEIYIPCIADLPDSRAAERELLQPQGIQSLIVVPMTVAGELLGFIGFDAVATMRDWSPIERQLLMAAADIIGGGIARGEMYQELAAKERRFSRLLRYSADLTLIVSDDFSILYASEAVERITGWTAGELLGRRVRDLLVPESYSVLDALPHQKLPEEGLELRDVCALMRNGTRRWLGGHICDVRSDPEVGGYIINLHDITVRKQAEEALQYQALHDPLTGLANRALLAERLEMLSENDYLNERPVGLLFLDLDHFKSVNDTLGHDVGDLLLVDVADRLRRAVAEIDLIARFGGDEFVVLLEPGLERNRMVEAAAAVMDVFENPFTVDGEERLVSASAGLVISDRGHEAAILVRDADAAMYQAKLRGRSRLEQFDMALQSQLQGVMELSQDLRDVHRRNELRLHFQPLLGPDGTTLLGMEALLRWEHPARGLIYPEAFLSLSEENGSVTALGDWVLANAARQLRDWDRAQRLPAGFTVSVNVSARQLSDSEFPVRARRLVEENGSRPERFVLDVRESAVMSESDAGLAVLTQLASFGFRLALDDFGSGWSSMAYLRDLPIQTLKFDARFTDNLERSERDRKILMAMMQMASSLGLQTHAKGVETQDHLKRVRELGCGALQGYELGRPTPGDAVEQWLPALAELTWSS